MSKTPTDYLRGMRTGRLEVINAIRTLLEESERVSILSILATLERLEQEILEATQ